METTELLTRTRQALLTHLQDASTRAFPATAEVLYRLADASFSSQEQRTLLQARSFLLDKAAFLRQRVLDELEQLLNRSFQTTYRSFRPHAALAHSLDQLSLVDAHALEDELRIKEMTDHFRSEAEEPLRDLNIRIALMFGQSEIKERENPFRPYILVRALSNAIEASGLDESVQQRLFEQLGVHLAKHAHALYGQINEALAQHGIAAQLPLKTHRTSAPAAPARPVPSPASEGHTAVRGTGNDTFRGTHPPASSPGADGTWSRYSAPATPAPLSPAPPVFPAAGEVNGAQHVPAQEAVAGGAAMPTHIGHAAGASFPDMSRGDLLLHTVRAHAGGADQTTFPASQVGTSYPHGASQVAGMSSAQSVPLPPTSSAPSWLNGVQAVGEKLRQFFSKPGVPAGPLPTAMSETPESHAVTTAGDARGYEQHPLQQALSGFQAQQPAGAALYDAHGGLRNLILEERQALNEQAQNVDEQMTIDVVAMLFEFILRDPEVPAEVRAQLGRLQFFVLKLALRDSSLLIQKGHPARVLVNRIGSISQGLRKIEPIGAHVTGEICRIVETLLQSDVGTPGLFSRLLDEFDAFVARELRQSDETVQHTVAAVERAQHQTLRITHISAQLAEALNKLTVHPFLRSFLEKNWIYAIESVEHTHPDRAERYRLLVPDLLWSIIPKHNEEDRSQLFALLPIIVGTLREGLVHARADAEQQRDVLNWLVDAHTSALRAPPSASEQPALAAIHQHFRAFVLAEAGETPPEEVDDEQASHLLEKAIRELDLKVQFLDAAVVPELPKDLTLHAPAEIAIDIHERLLGGVALEVNLGGRPSRGCLTWVNPNYSNLILSLDGQPYPSILSVRVFKRMLECGRVKFLEPEPLFERAVRQLLESADALDRLPA